MCKRKTIFINSYTGIIQREQITSLVGEGGRLNHGLWHSQHIIHSELLEGHCSQLERHLQVVGALDDAHFKLIDLDLNVLLGAECVPTNIRLVVTVR